MLVNATAMLQSAEKGHYGIGAFNTNNLEWASSMDWLKENTQFIAKWQTSFKIVADMVKQLVEDKNITVPVALHLDHGSYDQALACIEAGFTSVMYDGSHEADFETNLKRTAEIVKLAHSKGISVEAEVGGIGGTEDGVTSAGELADPEQCKAIADLGVDFLACGIGNIRLGWPLLRPSGRDQGPDRRPAPRSPRWYRHPRRPGPEGRLHGHLQGQRQH